MILHGLQKNNAGVYQWLKHRVYTGLEKLNSQRSEGGTWLRTRVYHVYIYHNSTRNTSHVHGGEAETYSR